MSKDRISLKQRAERRNVAYEIGTAVRNHRDDKTDSPLVIPIAKFTRWCEVFGIQVDQRSLESLKGVQINPDQFPSTPNRAFDRPRLVGSGIAAIAAEYITKGVLD